MCFVKDVEFLFVLGFPSWAYYVNHVVCFLFNIIQIVLTIFLNYLAIHALWRSSQLRRKTTLFLVMLLSVIDLAIGLIVEPIFLIHLGHEIYGQELDCFIAVLERVILDAFTAVSFTTFIVLNIEIYLSIIYPIFHRTKCTNKRVLRIVCLLGIATTVRSTVFIFYLDKRSAKLFVTAFISLTLAGLAFIHIKISVIVYRRRRIGFVHAANSSNVKERKSFLNGVREAKSCLLVLLCTIVCYMPAGIDNAITGTNTLKVIFFYPWRVTLILSASVLNSIVFFWRNGVLRREARNLLQSLLTILTKK